MGQQLDINIAGLYTFPSDLASVPQGALSQADNIIIDQDNVAAPRRGFDYLRHGSTQSQFSNPSFRANKIFFYQGQILCQYDASHFGYHNSSTGWVDLSTTLSPPSATIPCRSSTANRNFYITSSAGVYKLDSYSATPRPAGAPFGLDTTLSLTAGSWLQPSYRTAYRIVWGIQDANTNLILGAPSQFVAITNTTASASAVQLVFTVPASVTTAYFYQIYRAAQVSQASPGDPADAEFLVYQGSPSSTDISNGYVTFTDVTPDSLFGVALYTSSTQQGIGNAYWPPPQCNDIATFRNCMFYANTSINQQHQLTLLGVGSPNGLQVGDTLTIDGKTFTAGSSENIGTATFAITPSFTLTTTGTVANASTSLTSVASTTGVSVGNLITGTYIPAATYVTNIVGSTVTMSQAATGAATGEAITFTGDSAAQAIRDTSYSLIRVINRNAASTVYAYYLSSSSGLPGQIQLISRSVGASAFAVTSSRATCWNPALPSSGTTQSSSNSAQKNGLYYSVSSQPESVPLGNYLLVGSADKNILRVLALRDSLFVLKEDGAFRVYGTDPTNFQVVLLDNTSILIAPETATVLNNQIYALTTQGVVSISETGVQILSHPIESSITSLSTVNYSVLQQTSFGVSYESQRTYYLWVITGSTDTVPTQYYRYNYITGAWAHGTLSKTCGGNNPVDDKLYLGNETYPIIDVERKSLTYSDYADYAATQTISAVSGTTVYITSSDTIAIGSIIYQSPTVFGEVVATNPVAGTVTTSLTTSLSAGSADVLSPISCAMSWVPITFQNPGLSKHVREVALLFLSDFNGTGTVGFSTDLTPNQATETLQGSAVGGWGLFAWGGPGETPLGANWGGANRRRPIRALVPQNHQRCSIMTLSFSTSYAYAPWQLQGVSVIGNGVSERTGQ